jgi:hypothetical protein
VPVAGQVTRKFSLGQVYDHYAKNNPNPHSRKHYLRALVEMTRQTQPEGELVPESEIDFDRYGIPKLKEGQVLATRTDNTPGKRAQVYQNVLDLETKVQKRVHEVVHEGYTKEYGTDLEIQTWQLKKDPARC